MLTASQAMTLALRHHQAGDLSSAESLYRQVLQAEPGHAAAHFHLGRLLKARGRLDEAAACYQESLRFNPTSAAAHNNLGDAFTELGRLEEASAALREAIHLKADFPEAHNNLGIVLARQGRLEEAEVRHRESLRLNPTSAAAHNNLGNVLREQGRFEEGLVCLAEAIRLRPDYAEARRNRGMTWLLLGEWARGWPEYEWRRGCKDYPPPPPQLPPWDGSPLGGRTILLRAEQGLGDTLHFIRYAPLVKERGGRVVLECQAPLTRLLAGCKGVDRILTASSGEPNGADTYAPLMSLPGLFGTTPSTVPAQVPYLVTDSARTAAWRRELAPLGGFKIGIVWQGNPNYAGDRWRSVPLEQFLPLASVPGVRLVSLQKVVGREQLPLASGPIDLGPRLADFTDTAAVMESLNLVIAVDTVVAHLAGALGVPVWLALPWPPEWRWLLGREDSPWYPTMRLFRQRARGDWPDVFARITVALRATVGPAQ
jgi:Tfp pilus assembly protein PilF